VFFCTSKVLTECQGSVRRGRLPAIGGPGLARILGLVAGRGKLGPEMEHDRPLCDAFRQVIDKKIGRFPGGLLGSQSHGIPES